MPVEGGNNPMRPKIGFVLLFLVAGCFGISLRSQTPAPIVIQAQTATTAPVPSTRPSSSSVSMQEAASLLEEIKAANEETIKKQQAALDTLDELEKAADQLRIFAKRG